MKANELRIGNLIQNYQGDILECFGVTCEGHERNSIVWYDNELGFYLDIEEIKPIELTEDWLLGFGFVKIGNSYKMKNFGRFIFTHIGITFRPAGMLDSLLRTDLIKYVHQLQNLYFALTGEELTIKQS